ncbi:MAG: alpha/beta fold hydrolase [Planctomycetota bacterium]
MIERFSRFPKSLAERARAVRLGDDVPAMVAHPDWDSPAPWVLWMHGRTVSKELDPGRYLRWTRAGIAAVAIDLPGHGERAEPGMDQPARSLDVLEQALGEIDGVVRSVFDTFGHDLFDPERIAIGGMSLGGMVALRRLCDPHPFIAAAVESTTGWLEDMYFGDVSRTSSHPVERVRTLQAYSNLSDWRPIPLLSLHSEADETVPWRGQAGFLEGLRAHYTERGAEPSLIESITWPETGAPYEHAGFGKRGTEAKNLQVEFLSKALSPGAAG